MYVVRRGGEGIHFIYLFNFFFAWDRDVGWSKRKIKGKLRRIIKREKQMLS
jgi:hypothetical protein